MAPAILEVMARETKNNVKLSVDTGRKEKHPAVIAASCAASCSVCHLAFQQ